jgi:hypothetical protein
MLFIGSMERVRYYLGAWTEPCTIQIPATAKEFNLNKLYWYQGPSITNVPNFRFDYGTLTPGFWWYHGQHGMLVDIPCLTISADGIDNEGLPALAKVRRLTDPSGGLLWPAEYARHWGHIKESRQCSIHWGNKLNGCVWRGAPTGLQSLTHNPRILVCKKYGSLHNIGITQTWDRYPDEYVRPPLTIVEMLKYKYIISLEGNDKDSGLNWKLASNSLVLMPPPTVESWLMEGLLRPYEHYVPLAAVGSDLEQVIAWCNAHENDCLRIIANANAFMQQFDDLAVEKKIFEAIKAHYLRSFTFS